MSYWLFLLLLDLSTILTVSVGALPLKIGKATEISVPNVAPHVKITTGGVAVYYKVKTVQEKGVSERTTFQGNVVSCVFEG